MDNLLLSKTLKIRACEKVQFEKAFLVRSEISKLRHTRRSDPLPLIGLIFHGKRTWQILLKKLALLFFRDLGKMGAKGRAACATRSWVKLYKNCIQTCVHLLARIISRKHRVNSLLLLSAHKTFLRPSIIPVNFWQRMHRWNVYFLRYNHLH